MKRRLRFIAENLNGTWQHRQAETLLKAIKSEAGWRILDIGGTGELIERLFPDHGAIVICDLSDEGTFVTRDSHTIGTKGDLLPFPKDAFDFVFCAGLIEHVTGPKQNLSRLRSSVLFKNEAWRWQFAFAQEIKRVAQSFFVETPHKLSPLDHHTRLPVPFSLLPRPQQIDTLVVANKLRVKMPVPDWNLLTSAEMQQLFPEAEIVVEKSFGLPQSIVAIQS